MTLTKAQAEGIEIIRRGYRHILADEDGTLCHIDIDEGPRLACDCGHPDCQKPPNCPACLQVERDVYH